MDYAKKECYIRRKYENMVSPWEGVEDDRGLAYNLYRVMLETCDEMDRKRIESAHICVAVNEKLREDEEVIGRIIEHFTGLQNVGFGWMTEAEINSMEVGVL